MRPCDLILPICLVVTIYCPCWAFGQPICFSVGAFAVKYKDIELAAQIGIEIIHEYRFEESPDKDDEVAEYLDKAKQYKIKVMLGFDRGLNYNERRIVERVNRFKNHDALWGWYLVDEPKEDMKDRIKSIAKVIKQLDVTHPTLISSDNPEFIEIADINFAYEYPIWDKPYPKSDLSLYTHRTQLSRTLNTKFLSLLQTFNYSYYRPKDPKKYLYRYPTVVEIRNMAYTGIILGSSGLFFFSFQTLPNDRSYLDNVIVPLILEFKRIRPFLAWEVTSMPKSIEINGNLLCKCWLSGKEVFVMVVNPGPLRIAVKINVKYKKNISMNVSPPGNESLEPWGTSFYQIDLRDNF